MNRTNSVPTIDSVLDVFPTEAVLPFRVRRHRQEEQLLDDAVISIATATVTENKLSDSTNDLVVFHEYILHN